jgi:glutamate racemase
MGNVPILGIFDSGVGGFSVYKKVREVTSANTVYYGDCLRAPYGNREEAEIKEFMQDDIRFLQDEGATHFINACNSMSVITTDLLLKECNISSSVYTDMIRAFEVHASFPQDEKILLLATHATIRSGAYQDALRRKGATVFDYTYKDLAFAIENNATREELLVIIERGILYAKEVGATTIIYGCTHYPLVHGLFIVVQEKIEWAGEFINPAVYVAEEIKKWNLQGEKKFYPHSSKDTAVFIKNMVQLL